VIDETSYRRGHSYLTLAADADARKIVFVAKERDALTVAAFAQHLRAHKADPDNITAATIDMSPTFIKGISDHLPNVKITFDKFHGIAHASQERCAAANRKPPPSRACAGICSRTAANLPASNKNGPDLGAVGGLGGEIGAVRVWHRKMPSLFSDGLAISA